MLTGCNMKNFAVYQNMKGLRSKSDNWVKISDDFSDERAAIKLMKEIDADCLAATGESMSNELTVISSGK